MITTAKGLTSAYAPMGAVIVSDRIAEPFMHGTNNFTHGLTFGGHPALPRSRWPTSTCSRTRACSTTSATNEPAFSATLDGLLELPIVGDVRGAGYF